MTLVELPCAGALPLEHIYRAFAQPADGVVVLTCHPDICQAMVGNLLAHHRVDRISDFFKSIGFEAQRLEIKTVAANMEVELAAFLNRFKNKMIELGPIRLRIEKG